MQEGDGYLAAVDPHVTPDLAAEGLARELVSAVQRLRKDAGFAVSDRIRLLVVGVPAVAAAATAHRDWISHEVLAREMEIKEVPHLDAPTGTGPNTGTQDRLQGFDAVRVLDLDGLSVRIALTREVDS